MSLSSYHSQISKLQKEILDLDKKIFAETKKTIDKQSQINSVSKSITKTTSLSTLQSKQSQILRYNKESLSIQQKINDYEKQKRTKKESLNKRIDALKKEEAALQKRQQSSSRIQNSSLNFGRTLQLSSNLNDSEEPQIDFMRATNNQTETISNDNRVFITYRWESKEHDDKVFDFANYLRDNGFEADMDKKLAQQETSINFVKMMHKAMHDYPKIIIILSEGYKQRADSFEGGVGTEYELIINDINNSPNKYILASFQGRAKEITPAGFKGRDIVDLSVKEERTRLFEKLTGHERYIFAEVAKNKPKLPVKVARAFAVDEAADVIDRITIDPVIKATGEAVVLGGLYKFIDFKLKFVFTNITNGSIGGFNYIIKIPRELDLANYEDADPDGFVNYERSYKGTVFQKQRVTTEDFLIKVAHQNVRQIIGSLIKVDLYTEHGALEKEFQATELIKLKPGGEQHKDVVPLSLDLFIS
ncbi:SEFIR domain-containing protein [Pedobacter sp. WC2423]|uniref:SEFIR domain-containing protein n=1 Tax=Pedobacter sp. WC2423 TaxID=3234142 RepID=UPI003467B336